MEVLPRFRFLITAGPTREPVDPVRYLSNRSSGKMGYALAEAAARAGHDVDLVTGPVAIPVPTHPSITVTRVETAREMFDAVSERIGRADVAVMAAAVADYRPARASAQKIKKRDKEALVLQLEKTEDILGSARVPWGFGGVLVGFAAETENVAAFAREKLEKKRCDLIVANDVSRKDIGFDAETNEVCLFHADGMVRELPKAPKTELALELVRVIEVLVRERLRAPAP